MKTLAEIKEHFSKEGTQTIQNQSAGYQFVKKSSGEMFQFNENCEYKFYRTLDGLCKAALYRVKRG